MYIKWTKECYLCECPLEPCVHTRSSEERIIVRKYRKLRPIFIFNNEEYYKFINTTLKRVCYACHLNSYKIDPVKLRARECGRTKNICSRPKSKSREEILFWFDGLKRYLSKNHND